MGQEAYGRKAAQEELRDSNMAQERPKKDQKRYSRAPSSSKLGQLQESAKRAQDGHSYKTPQGASEDTRCNQDAPQEPQETPKSSLRHPKKLQEQPQTP